MRMWLRPLRPGVIVLLFPRKSETHKFMKRHRSPGEYAPPTGSAGRSGALGEPAGVPVSRPVDKRPAHQPLSNTPKGRSTADTVTDSVPGPLDSFLQQRLPYLKKNPLHTRSTATRNPKYYDMHIQLLLRLRRIVFVEDLLEVLSKICDEYVRGISGSGKDMSQFFPEFKVPSHENILDEKSLVAYFQVINRLYSRVASGLLFGTDWAGVFGFSPQAMDIKPSSEAAADAYLFINRDVDALLSSKDKSDIDLIRKYDLHNFVIWEYKNLGFGSDIFSALQSQEGDFHWITCQERSGRHDASSRCSNQTHRTEGRPTVTGRPAGPDAFPTIDIIKRSTVAKVLDDEEERPSKRLRRDMDSAIQKKVSSVLQQAWTSAVVQDASFIVISSGNEECIAIRHRESQTLFISPLIRPSVKTEPAYIKIYMALYIAAYKDVVDRARQLESDSLSFCTRSLLRLKIDDQPNLPNALSSGLFDRYPVEVEVPPLNLEIVQLLERYSRVDLRLHQHDLASTQYNRNTWTLSRFVGGQNDGSGEVNTSIGSESELAPSVMDNNFVFLDLDRLFDETSRIWRVYFGVAYGLGDRIAYFSEPLVLKMALDDDEGASLKVEFNNYQELENDGVTGAVKCYGLFSCQVNSQDLRYFLLLKDGGGPISKRPSSTRLAHTKKHGVYQAALKSFHKKNYTHNNITREHVLMDVRRGEAALISLKNCRTPDQATAAPRKARDIGAMRLCLGIPSEGEHEKEASRNSDLEKSEKVGETSKGKARHHSEVESNPFDMDAFGSLN